MVKMKKKYNIKFKRKKNETLYIIGVLHLIIICIFIFISWCSYELTNSSNTVNNPWLWVSLSAGCSILITSLFIESEIYFEERG